MSDSSTLAAINAEAESALKRFMSKRSLPLYDMMAYHLGWIDRQGAARRGSVPFRIHAVACLAAASALGAEVAVAMPCAIGVELIYNFSLMHSDIQEGNTERGAEPTVWWVWGPAQGINAGDGMHALARLALFELRAQGVPARRVALLLRVLDEATLRLCEGSYLDATFQERPAVAVDEYLDMAAAADGALMGCAARLGALAASGVDGPEPAAMDSFGEKLGTALRIARDYALFWPRGERDEPAQGRLLAKKKTLPVVHALATGDRAARRVLGSAYAARMLDPGDLGRITEILEKTGSKQFTRDTADRYLQESLQSLEETCAGASGGRALRKLATKAVRDLIG